MPTVTPLTHQQVQALRNVQAAAVGVLAASTAAQYAQQQHTASQLRTRGNLPQHARGGRKALAIRRAHAQAALSAHTAAQAQLRRAQQVHRAALASAVAVGLPRVQVPSLARALAHAGLRQA